MKAYPVKCFIVGYSLQESSFKWCCHLPLIHWLFFLKHPPLFSPWQCFLLCGFIQNSITFKKGFGERNGALLQHPLGLGVTSEESSAQKQFCRSTSQAVPLCCTAHQMDIEMVMILQSLFLCYMISQSVHSEDYHAQSWNMAETWRRRRVFIWLTKPIATRPDNRQ